jgi:hypothetical protein
VAVAALIASACGSWRGAPARLVVADRDTVVVNSRREVTLPVRALDSEGREVALKSPVSVRWAAGDTITVSSTGQMTCTRHADATVTVSSGGLSTRAVVHCRPVKSVHMAGPVQFILGDTAQRLTTQVLGLDGKPVDRIAWNISIRDRAVAGAEGTRITARSVGGTQITLTVGDESATSSIHVYQPVDALGHVRDEQSFVGVPLSLRSGEYRKWTLPPGTWMLTMTPYEDERRGLRLKVDGADCVPEPLTPRRISCHSKTGTIITVSHPSRTPAPELTGRLLVRRINS